MFSDSTFRFEHSGVQMFELQGAQKDAFSECLHLLPNVIDAAGNEDHNSAELREILEMVFGGT